MKDKIICGDSLEVLQTLASESIDCIITSPPYWGLRDYGVKGQLGLEKTPEEYVVKLVEIFREVKRVLKKEGTFWLNLGDSYSTPKKGNTETNKNKTRVTDSFKKELPPGMKPKNLVGIPWRVAFALQADGWYLRQDIIWAKPNPMPESVTDRCTKSHEYIFLLTKNPKYYFDNEAIKEKAVWDLDGTGTEARKDRQLEGMKSGPTEMKNGIRPRGDRRLRASTFKKVQKIGLAQSKAEYVETFGRNKRSVWTVTTKPYKEAHFATFPQDLIIPMVKAGCPENGLVLDPFMGSGTTAITARTLGRHYLGIELNPEYIKLAEDRLKQKVLF